MDAFPIPGLDTVPGFLTAPAAWLLDDLARMQTAAGIRGDIAEIGVFYGRASLVLGRTLREGERLVACDLFETGAGDVPGWTFPDEGPPEESFRRRWAEWVGDPGRLVVLRCDSAALRGPELGACRLVHVDGGHGYDEVRGDWDLAERALVGGGAVVFDDMLLPEWPDVTMAVADRLRERPGRLTPVLLAEHKLVACRPERRDLYAAWALPAARRLHPPPGHLIAERTFCGMPLAVVSRLRP